MRVKKLKKALLLAGGGNILMGIIEIISGIISLSSSLLLDALDFVFDGINYFSSIYALDKSHHFKTTLGKIKGWIMIITGGIILLWIIYKYIRGWVPIGEIMSVVAFLGLIINISSAFLLSKYRDDSLDIKAVWLCTRNDALNSIFIIISGILTVKFNSIYPDIIVSIWIGMLAVGSGMSIIQGKVHGHSHGHKH